MATQRPITCFFGSKKRRATDALERDAKLLKSDPLLLKVTKVDSGEHVCSDNLMPDEPKKQTEAQTTPRKGGCDIRSYLTSKSPYRPECRSETPVKFLRTDGKALENDTTPSKPTTSILKNQNELRPAVKKSISFENDTKDGNEPELADTDDIIKAANDLVEKMRNKQKTLAESSKTKLASKSEILTPAQLKKKLARSAKLAKLQSSLNRLGQQASELIKLEKKKDIEQPKITKFDSIEIDVPKSPHKGALASPAKSPMKPAYERFAHLAHRSSPTATLPLPFGYQRLLDLFSSVDTVCSMMLNRGEIVTFKKLKPAVQELTRTNFTERHLGQMAAVLPSAFEFRQDKLRNFGSTSKTDRYELVIQPKFAGTPLLDRPSANATNNLIRAAETKKMTPKLLQLRRDAFQRALTERVIDKHEEFLSGLDPPLTVVRSQLTRWHPNFLLDLLPEIPPILLPEAPNATQTSSTAKEVLERAKQMLSANERMRNALEAASRDSSPVAAPILDAAAKDAIDKKLAAHDPLKGISKSLLERIRAKQAAKALEVMKTNPADEKELLLLTQLPEIARIVRTLFVDEQKGVLPWDTVIEKIILSGKRSRSKGDVCNVLRRLLVAVPDWVSVFTIRNVEYFKLNRATSFTTITERLDNLIKEKRQAVS